MLHPSIIAVAKAIDSGTTHVYQHPEDVEHVRYACTAGICMYVPPKDPGVHNFVVDGQQRLGIQLTPRGVEELHPPEEE